MTYKRPVRTLKFLVVKERNRWLVRYKGAGGPSRIASKEEVQLALALREANEDRSKLRIQKTRYEYAIKGMRFSVELARQACGIQDASSRLIDLARQAAKKIRREGGRPDALVRSCATFETVLEDFNESVDTARDELGVAAPGKEKK